MTKELLNEIENDYWNEKASPIDMAEVFDLANKALEQEPKTGHWIGIDEEPHEDYECDKCGYVVSTYSANIEPHTEYKFCPNCGCHMVEPQESEDT